VRNTARGPHTSSVSAACPVLVQTPSYPEVGAPRGEEANVRVRAFCPLIRKRPR
jgi:hypothetical protein